MHNIVRAPPRIKYLHARGLPLRKLSKTARALLAADVASGAVQLQGLSNIQLSRLFGVSAGYIRLARGLDPMQRMAVEGNRRPLVDAHILRLYQHPAARDRFLKAARELGGIDAALGVLASVEAA
jgi:hypothetical protein